MNIEFKRLNAIVAAAIVIVFAVNAALRTVPWLVPYSNWTGMLLFSHDVQFLAESQTIQFANPSNAHSFFPLSFILSREYYLLSSSPLLVEFISQPIIYIILLALLAISWLRRSPSSLSYLTVFAVGALSLFYAYNDPFLWFNTVGLWELIVFLILLRQISRNVSRTNTAIALVLLIAIILGDDGIVFLAVISLLVAQVLLVGQSRRRYYPLIAFSALFFVAYQGVIGFVTVSYYGSYLPTIESQIATILSFDIQGAAQNYNSLHLSLYLVLPLDSALVALFVIIPVMLMIQSLRIGITLKNLLLPGAVLAAGLAMRAAYTVTGESVFLGHFFILVLYLLFPVVIFALLSATLRNVRTIRTNNNSHIRAMIIAVFCCVFILSNLGLPFPIGTIASTQDPRVSFVYAEVAAVYAHSFASAPLATEPIGDTTILLFGPSSTNSSSLLASLLYSPYSKSPVISTRDVYYSNGPMVILNR